MTDIARTQRLDSFKTRKSLQVGERLYQFFSLPELARQGHLEVTRLPYSLRVMLENLLRHEDGIKVRRQDVEALIGWDPARTPEQEIAFTPARVLLQDFTGVPAVVDLAVMRDAMARMGGDPTRINPLQPVDLVIDHSVQVDHFGSVGALAANATVEFERNHERYLFLRWGQKALDNFRVVPPSTGIVHQVNLEYLATVACARAETDATMVFPDTLVGTDSHTTMINGLGVVGWGVGGIEAEAAMLGQPISLLIPQVVGFKLTGRLPAGATATDLVLTVTQMLRKKGVVGKFVEFFGNGLDGLALADRATIANMAPEYGATVGFFPVDAETLAFLRFTGRDAGLVDLVEAYYREQGLLRTSEAPDPVFTDTVELDLSTVEPSLAGPKRPQDRVTLGQAQRGFREALLASLDQETVQRMDPERLNRWLGEGGATLVGAQPASAAAPSGGVATAPAVTVAVRPEEEGDRALHRSVEVDWKGLRFELGHGSVVIASITSCTNTSNPSVMLGAGLLAKKAVERGLRVRPWVKTSLAPGSRVVTEYLKAAGLLPYLEAVGFHVVGYGCTTCIGNSGPVPEPIRKAIHEGHLLAAAVLSGNRNFEGRINPVVRANYLASPPLVVAYALAGTMDINLEKDPLGQDAEGEPVYLREIWPGSDEVVGVLRDAVKSSQFERTYADVFTGEALWSSLPTPEGNRYVWEGDSTYIKAPPYFEGMPQNPAPLQDLHGARVLALLGDSVTTDHISPAGSIALDSPAGRYLTEHGVKATDFNSYGSRRGNHEVMVRGTFANIRLRNHLAPGTEGCWTLHLPDREQLSIFDAAMKYADEGVPLIVLAGAEYGTGSSRDWAAKGPRLLGVRAVIAKSFERIHRSNLIGMGILPLQFAEGEDASTHGLLGDETYDIEGIAEGLRPGKKIQVKARRADGSVKAFTTTCRIDTPNEVDYYRHGGILQYVLRGLLGG